MFALPFRRQFVVAVALVTAVVIDNRLRGGYDHLATQCAWLAVCSLLPVAFAWSLTAYRIAAGLLAALFTIVFWWTAFPFGAVEYVPVVVIMWLTVWRWRDERHDNVGDYWLYDRRSRGSEQR